MAIVQYLVFGSIFSTLAYTTMEHIGFWLLDNASFLCSAYACLEDKQSFSPQVERKIFEKSHLARYIFDPLAPNMKTEITSHPLILRRRKPPYAYFPSPKQPPNHHQSQTHPS